ncbi:lactonase family protein [Snuella sedimenti]|uniref:Lactonase family protein n=1 Tax=Snuella sedimenti TaxID=2798802 RepID=A0A8J7IT48_9FLAO|nr:lactonase family protein [Snuella sedimenti]MBJ6367475.1 lactonase family protein [Snuella sedimenti]
MDDSLFYTGSYTQKGAPAPKPIGKGIGCYRFNHNEGTIAFLRSTDQRNPSYLTVSRDGNYLFAIEELLGNEKPRVCSYKIGSQGSLSLINYQVLAGDHACYLAECGNTLVVANYTSGNWLSFPIMNDGSLGKCHQTIQHQGKGTDRIRQEGPHVHMVYPIDDNIMYAVDLGIDMLKAYRLDNTTNTWKALAGEDVYLEKGMGARHMVMGPNKDVIYVLGELSGEISVLVRQSNGFSSVQKISLCPDDYKGAFSGAAIRIHPNGNFLYASNRGDDSISVYAIDKVTSQLSLVAHYNSGDKTPRDFNIHPSGKWLIVANQDSNALVVFKLNPKNGRLSYHMETVAETPVNICWL